MNIWETIDKSVNNFELHLETEEQYPCFNYVIDYSISKTNSKIRINLKKILIPNFCLTAFGPATAKFDIGVLKNGTYDFSIKIDNIENNGILTVSEEKYSLTMESLHKLQIENYSLMKIPVYTYWGQIGYGSDTLEIAALSIKDSLETIGAQFIDFNPGYYGHFTINDQKIIQPPKNHGYYFINTIIFRFDQDFDNIKSFIEVYDEIFQGKLKITVRNWNGEWARVQSTYP